VTDRSRKREYRGTCEYSCIHRYYSGVRFDDRIPRWNEIASVGRLERERGESRRAFFYCENHFTSSADFHKQRQPYP